MSHQNQYLPFATGGGALVLSSSSYSALAARLSGFGNGVADPQQCNTVWRQASVVAAMIAQFCADYGPNDILDDGNVAGLESNFLAALQTALAQIPAIGTPYEGVDTSATANAAFVTTFSPTLSSLTNGQVLLIQKNNLDNTGAMTLKVGAASPSSIKLADGSDLMAGQWPANSWAGFMVEIASGTTTFQMLTPHAGPYRGYIGTATGSGVSVLYTTTLTPAPKVAAPGMRFLVPITTTNAASASIDFGFGAKTIVVNSNGLALTGNEMLGVAGSLYYADFLYDGTSVRLLNPLRAGTAFNIQTYTTSTRVAMSGTGSGGRPVTAWSPGSYVKKSSTSNLLVQLVAPTFSLASAPNTSPASAANITLNVGAASATSVAYANSTVAATFTGLAAGSLAISVVYSNYYSNWVDTFCPNSTDASYFAASTSAFLRIEEVEPS